MGDEATADARRAALAPYRIDDALLDRAAPGRPGAALPARAPGRGDHRGGPLRPRQAIWDQAENRRHAQKALLELLLAA
jgi:ornithine carbamoyltransferase